MRRLVNMEKWGRLSFLAAIMGLCYAFVRYISTFFLQCYTAEIVAVILRILKHTVVVLDDTIIVDEFIYEITKDCTYIELYIYSVALMWRPGRLYTFLASVIGLGVGLFWLNTVRIVIAIHLELHGCSWLIVHDIPSIIIWCVVLFAGVARFAKRYSSDANKSDWKPAWPFFRYSQILL